MGTKELHSSVGGGGWNTLALREYGVWDGLFLLLLCAAWLVLFWAVSQGWPEVLCLSMSSAYMDAIGQKISHGYN